MKPRVSDLIAQEASRAFVGRSREIGLLLESLNATGPAVVYLHGIAGIGKSALVTAFVERASRHKARVIVLDCRSVEPTENGFLRALGSALGRKITSLQRGMKIFAGRHLRIVLVLDHFELCRLLDAWLRQKLIPQLPGSVRVIVVSREPPSPAWSSAPGWRSLVRTVELDALHNEQASKLLTRAGIPAAQAARINGVVRGHPLALALAAATLGDERNRVLEDSAIQRVIAHLSGLYLADISDPLARQALEASCAVRRTTVPLLKAMLPGTTSAQAFETLRALPFVHSEKDGLHVHDSVKQAVTATLRSADPTRYDLYRRAAWSELRTQLTRAPGNELWRFTADMLFLLDNPVIREAFFPSESAAYNVEPARADDDFTIRSICTRHEGKESAAYLSRLWESYPGAFSVAHGASGEVAGFYCLFEPGQIARNVVRADPISKAWLGHLRKEPVPSGQIVLFLRRWLSESEGEAPSPAQAACWLDIKRTYLALRPRLRRVYLTLKDLRPFTSVARTLGFRVLESEECNLDGSTYHTAMLDFGPSSVDGWLAGLVAAELQIETAEVLDVERRALVVNGRSIPLTRLEFAVMSYLRERKGKPVSRDSLIRDVWGHKFDVGSNVVDVVIKSVRKKLGERSNMVETVTGHGYKLRQEA